LADKPAALLLAPECPYPPAGGGHLRSAALTEYLARRYRLDAAVFLQPGGVDPRTTRLGELTHRIGVLELPDHARHTAARAVRNLARLLRGVPPLTDRFAGFEGELARFLDGRDYELAVVEHFWCAGYVDLLGQHAKRTALDLHNIESVLHAGCAAAEPWPLSAAHRQFQRTCYRLERRWLPRYDSLLVASRQDAARARRASPRTEALVYPNTIPWRPLPERDSEDDAIVFSANMEYHPNVDAVRYFRRRIWPLLRERWPGLVWRLVGRNPEAVTRYVADDERIQRTGAVDDAVEELARAKVAIVPLRAGSGTRVKILEAWAAGIPVVSTTLGAEGLDVADGRDLVIADEPERFADAVSALLSSLESRRRIGSSGRALFEREYTWESGWKILEGSGL
jgi:glycosyltransferase involved in cell wall biosynthesis